VLDQLRLDDGVGMLIAQPDEPPFDFEVFAAFEIRQVTLRDRIAYRSSLSPSLYELRHRASSSLMTGARIASAEQRQHDRDQRGYVHVSRSSRASSRI
jgi:hypothetical protein